MKCLILTATQGNSPEGCMRECEAGCQFYYETEIADSERAGGKIRKVENCRLRDIAYAMAKKMEGR